MRVLLVDDDPDLLDVTAYALRRQGLDLITASDGHAAVEHWEHDRPDVVVLDVNMPGPNGIEVCRIIRNASPTPVILLTARREEDEVEAGFSAGADDYVTKPFSPRQLVLRIKAVARRAGADSGSTRPMPLTVGPLLLDPEAHQVRHGAQTVQLTPIEFRVFYLLASNVGRVVTLERLVDYVWGFDSGDPALLKTHVCHIRQKLGLGASGPGQIGSLPRVGYRLVVADHPSVLA